MWKIRKEYEVPADGYTLILRRMPLPELLAFIERVQVLGGANRTPGAITQILDDLTAVVVGWRGLTARLLRETYRVDLEVEGGGIDENADIPFSSELLRELILYAPGFSMSLVRAMGEFIQQSMAVVERTEKNSSTSSPGLASPGADMTR